MQHVKCTEKTKNAVYARESGIKKINAGTDKEKEKNCLGHWLRRNCVLKDAVEGMVNGKKARGRRRYQMIDIMINDLCEDTKKKAEKRVECRMLSLQ